MRAIREILKQGDGQAKKKTDGILTSIRMPNKEENSSAVKKTMSNGLESKAACTDPGTNDTPIL